MAQRGEIRKLYKAHDKAMLWGANDANISGGDFSAMLIADAIEALLKDTGKPMSVAELAVGSRLAGTRATRILAR